VKSKTHRFVAAMLVLGEGLRKRGGSIGKIVSFKGIVGLVRLVKYVFVFIFLVIVLWEFDLVYIGSSQGAKPIIIPPKTLVKL